MEIKFFNLEGLNNVTELKTQYKKLVLQHHPDKGGRNEDMQAINAEYEYLFNNVHNLEKIEHEKTSKDEFKSFHDLNDGFREMIINMVSMEDVDIEIIGSWLWVTGEGTKNYIDTFKTLGFKWSKSKKAWYWYKGMDNKKYYRGRYSLDKCRYMHGSSKVSMQDNTKKLSNTKMLTTV